jgi:hypothetical protein
MTQAALSVVVSLVAGVSGLSIAIGVYVLGAIMAALDVRPGAARAGGGVSRPCAADSCSCPCHPSEGTFRAAWSLPLEALVSVEG